MTASIAMLPMPGQEKIFSTSTVPPTRKVNWTSAVAISIATRHSSRVAGRRSSTSSITSWRIEIDVPKSPPARSRR